MCKHKTQILKTGNITSQGSLCDELYLSSHKKNTLYLMDYKILVYLRIMIIHTRQIDFRHNVKVGAWDIQRLPLWPVEYRFHGWQIPATRP